MSQNASQNQQTYIFGAQKCRGQSGVATENGVWGAMEQGTDLVSCSQVLVQRFAADAKIPRNLGFLASCCRLCTTTVSPSRTKDINASSCGRLTSLPEALMKFKPSSSVGNDIKRSD